MVQVRIAGYGITKNLGNYENYQVYLEGNLDEGESYLDAIATLKAMCESDLKDHSIKSYKEEVELLKLQIKKLNRHLDTAREIDSEAWEEMNEELEQGNLHSSQLEIMRRISDKIRERRNKLNTQDLPEIPF